MAQETLGIKFIVDKAGGVADVNAALEAMQAAADKGIHVSVNADTEKLTSATKAATNYGKAVEDVSKTTAKAAENVSKTSKKMSGGFKVPQSYVDDLRRVASEHVKSTDKAYRAMMTGNKKLMGMSIGRDGSADFGSAATMTKVERNIRNGISRAKRQLSTFGKQYSSDGTLMLNTEAFAQADSKIKELDNAIGKKSFNKETLGKVQDLNTSISEMSSNLGLQTTKVKTNAAEMQKMSNIAEKLVKNRTKYSDVYANTANGMSGEMDRIFRNLLNRKYKSSDDAMAAYNEHISKVIAEDGVLSQSRNSQAYANKTLGSLNKSREGIYKTYRNYREQGLDIRENDEYRELARKLGQLQKKSRTNNGLFSQSDMLAANNLSVRIDKMANSSSHLNENTRLTGREISKLNSQGARLTNWWNKYGEIAGKNKGIKASFDNIYGQINSGNYSGGVGKAKTDIDELMIKARKGGYEIETFGSKMNRMFGVRFKSALAGMGVFGIQAAMMDLAGNVVKVDTAMTELKKVTNESGASYDKFYTNATARAKKYGATLTDTINTSASFAKLGSRRIPLVPSYGDIGA